MHMKGAHACALELSHDNSAFSLLCTCLLLSSCPLLSLACQSNSPGANMNFESVPFKLTSEFVQLMGGEGDDNPRWNYFKLLVIRGYLEARRHAHRFLLLAEITSRESNMACWGASREATLTAFRDRFNLDKSEEECVEFAYAIIEQSTNNWRTNQYDHYQAVCNGIA